MNWTRVKTILIWLFVAVNIVLVFNIVFMYNRSVSISNDTINDTVGILKRNGITINPSIISNRGESMRIHEAVNIASDPASLASQLLGAGYADAGGGKYQKDGKTLTIQNGRFMFTDPSPSDAGFNMKENGLAQEISGLLKRKGIDLTESVNSPPVKNDKGYDVTFYRTVDGKKIFESSITVSVVPAGVSSIRGVWLNPVGVNSFWGRDSIILRQITGILVDLIKNPDIPKGGNITITGIELGYSVGGDTGSLEHKGMTLIPAYRISTSDGKCYMYDARNGEYYKTE